MKSTREELLARRRQLQERLAREERQRRIDSFLHGLREAGAEFEAKDTHGLSGYSLLAAFPAAFINISWSQVPDCWELSCFSDEQRADAFVRALGYNNVSDASTELVIEWPTGPVQVRMRFAEVVKHALVLLGMDMDTWCWRPGHRWLVEVHHDDRVSWGDAPAGDPRIFW